MKPDASRPESAEPATTESTPNPTTPPAGGGVDLARAMLSRARDDAKAKAGGRARRSTRSQQADAANSRRSGAAPDDRDPQPISQVLERLVEERGWQTSRAVGGVEGRWGQLVGAELADHCQPESFDEGVLTVRADSTAWATQVRILAGPLLARLNTDLGAGTVTSLRVLGPTGPSWKKGRLAVKGRGPRDTYG